MSHLEPPTQIDSGIGYLLLVAFKSYFTHGGGMQLLSLVFLIFFNKIIFFLNLAFVKLSSSVKLKALTSFSALFKFKLNAILATSITHKTNFFTQFHLIIFFLSKKGFKSTANKKKRLHCTTSISALVSVIEKSNFSLK